MVPESHFAFPLHAGCRDRGARASDRPPQCPSALRFAPSCWQICTFSHCVANQIKTSAILQLTEACLPAVSIPRWEFSYSTIAEGSTHTRLHGSPHSPALPHPIPWCGICSSAPQIPLQNGAQECVSLALQQSQLLCWSSRIGKEHSLQSLAP